MQTTIVLSPRQKNLIETLKRECDQVTLDIIQARGFFVIRGIVNGETVIKSEAVQLGVARAQFLAGYSGWLELERRKKAKVG